MTYETLPVGAERVLPSCRIRSIPVTHAVPAVGYLIRGARGSLAFSGDTTVTDEFWRVLNATDDLRHVIIEASFLDADLELARISKHLCPAMLAGELKKLKSGPQVHVTHLMPGREDDIMREIARHVPNNTPRRIERGQVFEL